uniref:G_PROTEIN_RECEP_F1_2 domain-containing protein n=1 Tax=Parastrongyloides trichosuri TaxID=131310 RepID=A0A0N5A3D7_PARTI
MSTFRNETYIEIFPAYKEPETTAYIIAFAYMICLLVGLCGNTSMLTMIWSARHFSSDQNNSSKMVNRRRTGASIRGSCNSIQLYVIALCIVDTITLLSLPLAMSDLLVGFWMFGKYSCKIYRVSNSVGKMASTFLITALSIDRYIAIGRPQGLNKRTNKQNLCIVLSIMAAAAVTLSPVIMFATSEKKIRSQKYTPEQNTTLAVIIFQCVDGMPSELFLWFTGLTFVIGYVIPMILLIFVNGKLILKIRTHQREISVKSVIPIKKITTYIISLAVLYFACWTPYWVSVLYVTYIDLFKSKNILSDDQNMNPYMLIYFTHILPYMNTSVNWFLYGRLANTKGSFVSVSNGFANYNTTDKSEVRSNIIHHEAQMKQENGHKLVIRRIL